MKIGVSFLTSKDIKNDLEKLDKTSANYIHVDVMDGKFVEKINEPFLNIKDLKLNKPLDVHLMVEDPKDYILKYKDLNTEYITIHHEIKEDKIKLLHLIKSYNIKCGIAINPDTNINVLQEYLDHIDLILIMSVVPGKGGQTFIENTTNKLEQVKELNKNKNIIINIDGGINNETVKKVIKSDMVVSGSYILNGNYEERINSLK